MSFDGDLYPTSGAAKVMTTKGDIVRYDSQRERYGIGSTNQVLSVTAGLPAWKTLTLADSVLTTAGDILYENNTPELARLAKGSDGDVLTLASGLPSWASSSGGGALELLGSNAATSDTTNLNVSGLSVSSPDSVFCTYVGNFDDSQDLGIQVNGITGSVYNQSGVESRTSGVVRVADSNQTFWDAIANNIASAEKGCSQFRIFCNPSSELLNCLVLGGGDEGTVQMSCENSTASTTTITQVRLISSGAGNNIRDGSVLNVYKVSGS